MRGTGNGATCPQKAADMTYVMTIENADEVPVDDAERAEAIEQVRQAGHQMHACMGTVKHDEAQQAMVAALVRLYLAERTRFELSGGSMTHALNFMDRFDMIDLDAVHPQFPRQQDYAITPEMWDYPEDGEVPEPLAAYQRAHRAATDAQAEKPAGIPLYKLQTNDEWLVTSDEIRAALTARAAAAELTPARPEPDTFWWPHWLAFLELAADHGGFRVR